MNILFFTSRSEQINGYLSEKIPKQTVLGEIVHCTSVTDVLAETYSIKIVCSTAQFRSENTDVAYYLVDYLTLPQIKHLILTPETTTKVKLFCFWGRHMIPDDWIYRERSIGLDQVLTPYPHENNTFSGFYADIPIQETDRSYDYSSGLLWCKDAEHIDTELMDQLTQLKLRLYATCDDHINYTYVFNLGLLPRKDYLTLLKNMKYVLGFGSPQHGPTLVEALLCETMVMCPSQQVHPSLRDNPNVVITDGMSPKQIAEVMQAIAHDKLVFDDRFIPLEYTWSIHKNRVNSIFHIQADGGLE